MIRPELVKIAPDYHGAIDFAELAQWGIAPDDILDFSVNSNPFGPAESVREAIATAQIDRYPDKECLALRAALSEHLSLPTDQILVGNGSAELMWLTAFARLRPADKVLVISPTFGEYLRNAQLMGAHVTRYLMEPENDFVVDPDGVSAMLLTENYSLVHLCNPNNPTGQIISNADIQIWANNYPDTLFVIDEAYFNFVDNMPSAVELNLDNVLILRSMTKDYALAGIRLGYALGSPDLIAGLSKVRIPWSVNELAQAAGVAALAAQAEYEQMWERLKTVSADFQNGLKKLGYVPSPSNTHYFLLNVGDGKAFREKLLPHGLLVRLCESYGLPEFVRIACRTEVENGRLLKVMSEMKRYV